MSLCTFFGEYVLNLKKKLLQDQKCMILRNPSKSKAKAQTVVSLQVYSIHLSINYTRLSFDHCKKIRYHTDSLLIRHLCVFSTGLLFTASCEQWISVTCLLIPVTSLYLLAQASKEVRRAWSQKHLSNAQKFI